MQKRTNIQASSAIIILSILTILAQFATYYLFDSSFVIWGISCLISIVCCHLLLEQTTTYIACFNYSLITLFISFVIIIITYFGKVDTFLPYTGAMLGIALINWLIPLLHCLLRYMLDYGTKIDDFSDFYRNINIVFLLFYVFSIFYNNFAKSAFPWAYITTSTSANFYPFEIISVKIEDYIYGLASLGDIIAYLLSRILTYIPYGFFIVFVLRRQNRLIRVFALLLLPFLIEVLQFIIIPGRCDIDDLIYAFIGGLLGNLLFFLTNIIFRAFTGRAFMAGESDYRYSGHTLHF